MIPHLETGYHARVIAPDGEVVYSGPTPVPEELITISPQMAARGEMFLFVVEPDVNPRSEAV